MSPVENQFNHWSERIKNEDYLQELRERLAEYEGSYENLDEKSDAPAVKDQRSRLGKAIEGLKQEISHLEKLNK